MAVEPWAEYLAALTDDLHVTRRCVEQGGVIPTPPPRPTGPVPDELADTLHRVAVAYDQLALEVSTRLADIEAHLPGVRSIPVPQPQFVDRSA